MAKRMTPQTTGAKLELHKTTIKELTIRSGIKTGPGFSETCGGTGSSFCVSYKMCRQDA